jgi:hypothetical protein
MRARASLADTLARLGRMAEAAAHYRDLLRLNPGDNQGNRYSLAPFLYELGADEELERLLDHPEYKGDPAPVFTYLRALMEFRPYGESRKAKELLRDALRATRTWPAICWG